MVHRAAAAGGVEGYFERLSPMLRQAGGPSPHGVAALPLTYGIEFDVDSIQPCSRSN